MITIIAAQLEEVFDYLNFELLKNNSEDLRSTKSSWTVCKWPLVILTSNSFITSRVKLQEIN